MPVRRRTLALLAVLLAGGACSIPDDPGFISQVGVEVERVGDAIRVTSHRPAPVAFTVWNRMFLGLFAPCLQFAPECLRLQPEVPFLVPPEEIVGGRSEDLVIYWWTVVPGSDGPTLGELREIPVPTT